MKVSGDEREFQLWFTSYFPSNGEWTMEDAAKSAWAESRKKMRTALAARNEMTVLERAAGPCDAEGLAEVYWNDRKPPMPLIDWVTERLENCNRLAALKSDEDRAGWQEDAWYFQQIRAALSDDGAHE